MEKEYTYSAFISYSSKDEKVAKALWKKLEHYRLPAILQKQYEDIPEKMHIFLDQGDIVPGDTVENALSRELADSKKLIVICSHNSAKSPYVELEVKNFLSLGHSPNDIIPYIIEGEVNRDSPNNCYVPSLFGKTDKETINGVSVLRDGKWKAFVGVLANLLDVKFDEIYKREKVRRNRIIAALSGLGLLLICSMGAFIWYVTPHTKYYADYVTRWGIPEGIRELKESDRKNYPYHYKITFRAFRPVKLMHVNVKGTPVPETDLDEHQNRPRIAEYTYSHPFKITKNKQKWDLSEALYYYDSNLKDSRYIPIYKMKIVFSEISSSQSYVDFYYDSDDMIPKSLFNDVLSTQNIYFSDTPELSLTSYSKKKSPEYIFFKQTSSIFRFKIEYEEKLGWEKSISFYNKNNHSVHDQNGIKGYVLTHDYKGRVIQERYLYDDNNFYGFKNINTKKIEYDDNDNICKIGFYYINTNLEIQNEIKDKTISKEGNTGIITANDAANGLLLYSNTRQAFSKELKEKNEVLTMNTSRGYAALSIKWNKINNELVQTINYLDTNGKFLSEDIYKIERIYNVAGINKKNIHVSYNNCIIDEIITSNEAGLPAKVITTDILKNLFLTFNYSYTNINGILMQNYECFDKDDNLFIAITIDAVTENENLKLQKHSVTRNADVYTSQIYDKYGRYIENKVTYPDKPDIFSAKIIYRGDNRSVCYYHNNDYDLAPDDCFARADFAYTNDGMLSYTAFKNIDGSYVIDKNLGFSIYSAIYSPNALLLYEEYLDGNKYYIIPNELEYAYYEAENDIEDKILIKGKWLDSKGVLSQKSPNQFDYSYNSDGNLVVNFFNKNNFIVREITYYDNSVNTISSCWEENGVYNKVLYNYEGVTQNIYNKDEEGEAIWEYKNGILDYWYKCYFDGRKEEIFYKEGLVSSRRLSFNKVLESQSNLYYKNDNLKYYICNYSDGRKAEEFYDDDGLCLHSITYSADGFKEKEWFKEYENRKISYFKRYISGILETEERYEKEECVEKNLYYENGKIKEKWIYDLETGILKDTIYMLNNERIEQDFFESNCIHLISFDEHNAKSQEWFAEYQNGMISKKEVYWYTGTFAGDERIQIFKNGVLYTDEYQWKDNDKRIEFYDGTIKIKEEYYWFHGKNSGDKRIHFFKDGNLIKEDYYFKNKDRQITYYIDGKKIKEEYYWFQGKHSGDKRVIIFEKDKKIIEENYWKDTDKKIEYYKDGMKIKEEYYWLKGSFAGDKKIKNYVAEKLTSEEIYYSNGNKEIKIYENSMLKSLIKYYIDGEFLMKEWDYEDNNLVHFIGEYKDGRKAEEFYDKNQNCIHLIGYNERKEKAHEWFAEYKDQKIIKKEIYWLTGEFEGDKCIEIYESGVLFSSEYLWKNTDKKIDFYSDGIKVKEEIYSSIGDKKISIYEKELLKTVTKYYASGDTLMEEWDYEDGNLVCFKGEYKDESKLEQFYENGKLIRYIVYYADGESIETYVQENKDLEFVNE